MSHAAKIAVVCAMLVVIVGIGLLWRSTAKLERAGSHAERTVAGGHDSEKRTAADAAAAAVTVANNPHPAATTTNAPPPAEYYAESRIRAIIGNLPPEFHLSQVELEQLVAAYRVLQGVRSAHEISIATVKLRDGVLDVSIPNYAHTGAEIRSMLQDKFAQILGHDRGREAWQLLQNDIAVEFDMFGDSTQDLLATVVRADGNEVVRVERIRNWLVGDVSNFATSVYQFDVRQLDESEYVYMAPLLRRLVEPKRS